jgi:hypothetical protein
MGDAPAQAEKSSSVIESTRREQRTQSAGCTGSSLSVRKTLQCALYSARIFARPQYAHHTDETGRAMDGVCVVLNAQREHQRGASKIRAQGCGEVRGVAYERARGCKALRKGEGADADIHLREACERIRSETG